MNFTPSDYDQVLNTYINIFIFWWTDFARLESAFRFIFLDGFELFRLIYNQFALNIVTGIGFLSTENHYNIAEYLRTNDQGWINYLQMFGLVGYIIFAYIIGFIIKSLIKISKYRKDLLHLTSACVIIVMVGVFSNLHSDILKTHGIIQVFYTCLAIISYNYDSVRVKIKQHNSNWREVHEVNSYK